MERDSALFILSNYSYIVFLSFEKNKSSGRLLQSEDDFFKFSPADLVMPCHQLHLYAALTSSLK